MYITIIYKNSKNFSFNLRIYSVSINNANFLFYDDWCVVFYINSIGNANADNSIYFVAFAKFQNVSQSMDGNLWWMK